ncbi:hypothetical protein [Pantoea stewartii]|uniref:C-type lysozyme inhibitor domain-containing protein n=1 Tax=Pantoea stewartii subsp. stewartii DC283 TaxID=660596 RepID=A0ABN4Z515_PANSE|nr:hypothetical protein [Pantoea stewartii]ARF51915.1 hypothetical protein DSJ_12275 [Pantoea stewartii subsp. stewartii DC283]
MKIFPLLLICLTAASLPLVSSAKELTCSITHHIKNEDGSISSEIVGNDFPVSDFGNSFSFTILGKKIESPELTPVKAGDGDALSGKRGEMLFSKIDGSYVMSVGKEGYVISNCR